MLIKSFIFIDVIVRSFISYQRLIARYVYYTLYIFLWNFISFNLDGRSISPINYRCLDYMQYFHDTRLMQRLWWPILFYMTYVYFLSQSWISSYSILVILISLALSTDCIEDLCSQSCLPLVFNHQKWYKYN